MMELTALRQKVTRLIVNQNNGEIGNLRGALPRLDLIHSSLKTRSKSGDIVFLT